MDILDKIGKVMNGINKKIERYIPEERGGVEIHSGHRFTVTNPSPRQIKLMERLGKK